ncbi:MAG: hypothetical protein K2N27_09540 [Ruminococcus sp.]|nr:hypothetical protein [Ruminococcus sp.]
MKKTKKTLLTALAFTSAVGMTSCDLFGGDGFQNVYGPPPDYSSESSESSYNPYDDNMQSEYEAPIAYESETTTETTTSTTTKKTTVTTTEETTEPATDEYDPIKDEPSVVYGPPSYFE